MERVNELYKLASRHHRVGSLEDAKALCLEILLLDPCHAHTYHLLGGLALQIGDFERAVVTIQKAVLLNCNVSEFHYNLATAFSALGSLSEAAESYQRALALEPDFVEALCDLGDVLAGAGKLSEAIERYERALLIDPNLLGVLCSLGDALQSQGNFIQAIHRYEQALAIKPGVVEVLCNLGVALKALGRVENAIQRFEQALIIKPDLPEVLCNLGGALKDQGKLAESISMFQRALALMPDLAVAHSGLLLTMQYMPVFTAEEQFASHQQYAARFESPIKADWPHHNNKPDVSKRIRIGYVSGDFKNHSAAYFFEPILAAHTKSEVEIFCYHNNTFDDDYSHRMAAHADHWIPCSAMNDAQLYERIRLDGIDILVDLSGHTANNRLPVFARKPAPVQATWIGYAGTTGLTAMDYRITDAFMDPIGKSEHFHSETLIRLPSSNVAYRPVPGCPQVNTLPAFKNDTFVFASLNNLAKLNPSVVDLWCRILRAIPHSRLMLGNVNSKEVAGWILDLFSQRGIAGTRLMLKPTVPSLDYLTLHHEVDLALDPFPYNGGTTSMHSLWMGVPVLTLAGEHSVSRVGAAVLARAGLSQFVAKSEEEYMQIAVSIAKDLPALGRIRGSLRDQMRSAESDPVNITRELEFAYRSIWQKWCETQ